MSQNVWATIMPFGPVTKFLLAQKHFFGPAYGWPSFQVLMIGAIMFHHCQEGQDWCNHVPPLFRGA
jgi:hypothetical protein